MNYGTRIYELRKQKAFSQEEVASKLGVSRQSISLWETNQASPAMENLIAIAKLFNVSLDEIAGLKDSNQIDNQVEETPIFITDYLEDKRVVYKRDYIYLNSKADTIVFFISMFFLIFAGLSFISALNMEIQVSKIALIIGFISLFIGQIIYLLYLYVNILKKAENKHMIHIEFYDKYLIYDCTNCAKQKINYEMIDYYIAKKDYLILYFYKGLRIYVPNSSEKDIDSFLTKIAQRRKRKKPFWK